MTKPSLVLCSLFLALAACDSGPAAGEGKADKGEAKTAAKGDAKADAKSTESPKAEAPAEGPDAKGEAKAPEPEAAPEQPEPTAEPTAEPGPELGASELAALVGPMRFDPVKTADGKLPDKPMASVTEDTGTFMDHADSFGWAKDSSRFGFCQPSGGALCDYCTIVPVKGKTQSLEGGEDCDKDESQKIDDEWKKRGFGKQKVPKTWAFGRDITITWRVEPPKDLPDKLVPAVLEVGGKIGNNEPVKVMSFKDPLEELTPEFFPELIMLSPDGKQIAVVTHAWMGEFSSTLDVKVMAADTYAYGVYNRTGIKLLASDPMAAAGMFAQAAVIKPDEWKAHHNQACALALAGKPDQARGALEKSIAAGGDKAKKKANSDKDLATVREQAWFAEVAG